MHAVRTIFERELRAYFTTPLAYVFIVIFLALTGSLTFFLGGFFERGQADLAPFFLFHPWLYLFLVPAIAMRLWAEERRSGTIELLMTLPTTTFAAVLGKFLAAWVFAGIALLLTFPMWLTVNWLGDPDNGVILVSYLGSWLMAGAFIAIGACVSALTKNQVIAFVVGGRRLLPVPDERRRAGAGRVPPLGAAAGRRHGGLVQLPHPFRPADEGRRRPRDRPVLRLADRGLPGRSTRSWSTSRRPRDGTATMRKLTYARPTRSSPSPASCWRSCCSWR